MESKNINLIPEKTMPVYHASKLDSSRAIRCNLHEGASSLSLTGAELVRMRYLRPDGEHGSVFVPHTSGSVLDITIPSDAVSVPGRVYCKLKIGDLGCKAFIIEVERGV